MIKRLNPKVREELKKKKEIQNKLYKIIKALIAKNIITKEDIE